LLFFSFFRLAAAASQKKEKMNQKRETNTENISI